MSRSLTIVGASARAAACSAIRAGFEPHAIDLFADRDLAAVCRAVRVEHYPRDFLSALSAAPHVPWIYTGGLENYPRLIERMAQVRPLWGNRGAGLVAVRDPARLAQVCRDVGLPFPTSFPELADRSPSGQWLIKQRCSSGGLGVRFATSAELRRRRGQRLIQQFIPGQAASASFVAAGGRATLLGASRQILGSDLGLADRPFLYAGSIAPLCLPASELAKLQALGSRLAETVPLVGLFGIDFVRSDAALWPIEVNPRYTASVEVLERATGRDLLSIHAAACESATLPDDMLPATEQQVGKQIVYARCDTIVPPAFDERLRDWNAPSRPPTIADLPRVGDCIRIGQPVVTVFAAGRSESEVSVRLAQAAASVTAALGTNLPAAPASPRSSDDRAPASAR